MPTQHESYQAQPTEDDGGGVYLAYDDHNDDLEEQNADGGVPLPTFEYEFDRLPAESTYPTQAFGDGSTTYYDEQDEQYSGYLDSSPQW